MKQQVFLGMAASSVPVRKEVPELMEDLTAAGVRFVYFSPRNMRRSKPIAEKIGITLDWNCAISLRALGSTEPEETSDEAMVDLELDSQDEVPGGREAIHMDGGEEGDVELGLVKQIKEEKHCRNIESDEEFVEGSEEEPLRDPHRYISQYADWDVHARMPHGIQDIKKHLKEVDNVPLLVSLYTDSTPSTTRQMLDVFKSYGEVVLAVGSSYRAQNYASFRAADISVAIAQLPGDKGHLRTYADGSMQNFPETATTALTKSDLCLVFRMVGLGACPLLQMPLTEAGSRQGTPCEKKTYGDASMPTPTSTAASPNGTASFAPPHPETTNEQINFPLELLPAPVNAGPQLRMTALLEAVRMGRVLLLNSLQALAFTALFLSSLSMWPLISLAVPVSVPRLYPRLLLPYFCLFICLFSF